MNVPREAVEPLIAAAARIAEARGLVQAARKAGTWSHWRIGDDSGRALVRVLDAALERDAARVERLVHAAATEPLPA